MDHGVLHGGVVNVFEEAGGLLEAFESHLASRAGRQVVKQLLLGRVVVGPQKKPHAVLHGFGV